MKSTNALMAQNEDSALNPHYPLTSCIKNTNFGISIEKGDDKIILLLLIKNADPNDLEVKTEQDMLTIEVDHSECMIKNEISMVIEINDGKYFQVSKNGNNSHALKISNI